MDRSGKILTTTEISGLELAEVAYDPNVREPSHWHECAHFYLALEGACTEFYGNQVHEYRRLTAGFLPPNHSHSFHYSELGCRWFRIDIRNNWLKKLNYETRLKATRSHKGTLSTLFLRLYREFCQPDIVSSLVIEALVSEMLANVSRSGKPSDRKPPRWLIQAREFLEGNVGEQLNLITIAEKVDVHPVHLAREFRRYFNCTIGEYMRNRRIDYACHQLAASDASLAEIAHATGFCDQSHLSRTFKKIIGTTPARFRQELLSDVG